MAANITSGNGQSYEAPGIRIFQGIKPDVVCIQEFRYSSSSTSNSLRTLVDTAFGPGFNFYVEPSGNIPNGIVSRYPIVDAGSWDDPLVGDRGFAWAQIDLPGTTNDLYVVSCHLYSSGTAADRNTEATTIKTQIQANFPANAWVIVGGDMNTDTRSESAIGTFKTFLSDNPIPTDATTGGDDTTNANRNKPYDYLLPSFSLTNYLAAVNLTSQSFPKGLVVDTRVFSPLSDISPAQSGDSGVSGMQHMAIVKNFLIPTNAVVANTPPSITSQPQSQTNAFGGSATFSVAVSGTSPFAYQWRFAGTNLATATNSSLTLTNLQVANNGGYTVVVTNAFGSITSGVATLTVNANPVINTQPQGLSVNAGANATFTVGAAGGTPLFYQWRFGGVAIANATNSSFTRNNAQTGDAGNYTVVVTNFAGSVTSSIAVLNVNTTPPGIIAQWNFNSSPADASTTTGSTTPSSGSGTASLFGGTTATFATGDPSLDPAASDNTGWNTANYPAQGAGNKTRGAQFSVSTVGSQNISVTWSMRLSSTASKYARLQYTTNGTDFIDFANPVLLSADSVFERKTNDLSGISGVNNNANFAFRIVSEFESTAANTANANYVTAGTGVYGTGGTVRFDMVTISGSALVTGTAPIITNQPISQIVAQGDNATFSVGADGTSPLNYQWRFNATELAGATNSSYTRTNVQPVHVGSYSVVVSNSAGFAISSNVALNLFIPAPTLSSPAAGVLQWNGLSNLTYHVETSTNLAATTWTSLGTAVSPSTLLVFTNFPTTDSQRFYRVTYP